MELIIFIWGVGMLLQEEKGEKIRKNERMDMISEQPDIFEYRESGIQFAPLVCTILPKL